MGLLRRLLIGGSRSRSRHRGAYGPRSSGRRRSGWGFYGPFPGYSGRTRRGHRVAVRGCCLPIPLFMATAATVGARALLRRRQV